MVWWGSRCGCYQGRVAAVVVAVAVEAMVVTSTLGRVVMTTCLPDSVDADSVGG